MEKETWGFSSWIVVVVIHHQDTSDLLMSDLQTAWLSSCKLKHVASFRESIHLVFGLSLFLWSSTFPSIIFSRDSYLLMMCPTYDSLSFNIFASRDSLGLIWPRTHLYVFLAIQVIWKALLQHHISKESVVFLISFLYCPAFTLIHSDWKYKDLGLGLQWHILTFDALF